MTNRARPLSLLAAGLAAAGLLAGGYRLTRRHASRPASAPAAPPQDRPPQTAAYEHALDVGLHGNLAQAKAEFVTLAQAQQGTSAGAWALYQGALAARASHQPAEAERLFARLRHDYPNHPLSLRLKPEPAPAPRVLVAGDCGPRSLLALCQQARIPATLPELSRRCGTDRYGTTLDRLARAAREKGLRVEAASVDGWFLRRRRPNGIAWVNGDHYVAFLPGPDPDHVWLLDPNEGGRRLVSAEELAEASQGIVLLAAWGRDSLPAIPESAARPVSDPS